MVQMIYETIGDRTNTASNCLKFSPFVISCVTVLIVIQELPVMKTSKHSHVGYYQH